MRFGFRTLLWLADLHDNLLLAQTGRLINAAGGIFTVLLVLTGAVIWWPGIDTWRRSLSFRWKANPKGFNWTLHSALGFWTFAFFVMWAVTGIYLSIPKAFSAAVDFLEPMHSSSRGLRFGDQVLYLARASAFRPVRRHPGEDRLDGHGTRARGVIRYRDSDVVEARPQALAGTKHVRPVSGARRLRRRDRKIPCRRDA